MQTRWKLPQSKQRRLLLKWLGGDQKQLWQPPGDKCMECLAQPFLVKCFLLLMLRHKWCLYHSLVQMNLLPCQKDFLSTRLQQITLKKDQCLRNIPMTLMISWNQHLAVVWLSLLEVSFHGCAWSTSYFYLLQLGKIECWQHPQRNSPTNGLCPKVLWNESEKVR